MQGDTFTQKKKYTALLTKSGIHASVRRVPSRLSRGSCPEHTAVEHAVIDGTIRRG